MSVSAPPHAAQASHQASSPTVGQDAAEPTGAAALWDGARHVMGWLLSLFGAPAAIVEMGVLTPGERAEILIWLRPAEALARLLLLADAAAQMADPSMAPPPARTSRRAMPADRTAVPTRCDPANTERWRVSFRACPRASLSHSPPPAPSAAPQQRLPEPRREMAAGGRGADLRDPWPIAERVEAVIRVLEAPAPYARRLARRLAARAERRARIAAALLRPAPSRTGARRPRHGPADTLLAEARAHAGAALAAWDTG